MKYIKYTPHESLKKYIDFYWILETGYARTEKKIHLHADAYTDVVVNCGVSPLIFNNQTELFPGLAYVRGTATGATFFDVSNQFRSVGIRFKPGGFAMFYPNQLTIVNRFIPLKEQHLLSVLNDDRGLGERLDQIYKGIDLKTSLIEPIMDMIYHSHGNISIDELTAIGKMSQRSMERHFHSIIGVSPKEFIRIIRSYHAVKILQKGKSVGRMNAIAYELGYYDTAHFIKEIKKYSGFKPSEIFRGQVLLSG